VRLRIGHNGIAEIPLPGGVTHRLGSGKEGPVSGLRWRWFTHFVTLEVVGLKNGIGAPHTVRRNEQFMSQSSLVSVVTPFHNTVGYLEQCIKSVLSQSHGAFEYLLCDNCSTDGSTEIAERYAARDSRIRFMRFEELLPQVARRPAR
jgi:cellulose synthase/poly-beta-1,6-N-acetylglucosamine synthase-like glycosyltransferase